MVKLEKGQPLKKGQTIALIILAYIAIQAISVQLTHTYFISTLALLLAIGSVIVVATRRQPKETVLQQPIKKVTHKRTWKDIE